MFLFCSRFVLDLQWRCLSFALKRRYDFSLWCVSKFTNDTHCGTNDVGVVGWGEGVKEASVARG